MKSLKVLRHQAEQLGLEEAELILARHQRKDFVAIEFRDGIFLRATNLDDVEQIRTREQWSRVYDGKIPTFLFRQRTVRFLFAYLRQLFSELDIQG